MNRPLASPVLLLTLLSAQLAVARSAEAHILVEEEELTLELSGWAQAGYTVSDPIDDGRSHRPYIGLARLEAEATYASWGGAIVEIDATDGAARLHDLVARLSPVDELTLRVGRFKLPTSADNLISSSKTPFVNRAMVTDFVQSRLTGAELRSTVESDTIAATAQAGWFQAAPEDRELLPDGDGYFASVRGLLELPGGFDVHIAYLALVLADNAAVTPPEEPHLEATRPVESPELVDAALMWGDEAWTVHVEALLAPTPDEPLAWGSSLHVLRAFELPGDLAIEPGVRYGVVSVDTIATHRATAGLNFYILGNFLETQANYELTMREGGRGHAAYLQLQAGF